jgi:6-pyruvoyl-tetrahydropterin synthase
MTTLFIDNLTVIDASRLDRERGLVGESWRVDLTLQGTPDAQGMVLDFGAAKRAVKQIIDLHFDHKLLIPTGHPGCRFQADGNWAELEFQPDSGPAIRCRCPASAVTAIPAEAANPHSVAAAINARLQPLLPENITALHLTLRTDSAPGAHFHYTHGLPQHSGNCRRIAHGHRSRIEIRRNGQPDPELETRWAERWRDIYIGTRRDLRQELQRDGEPCLRFGYTTAEGEFELELAATRCYLIESDSTVENLARHVAETLKQEQPDAVFEVRLFEGIGKGAVYSI